MKKVFKANDISCINCANLIKGSLEDDFGEIVVNLDVKPREVTVEIKDDSSELLTLRTFQFLKNQKI